MKLILLSGELKQRQRLPDLEFEESGSDQVLPLLQTVRHVSF